MTASRPRTWNELVMGEVAPASKLRLFLRVSAVVLALDVLSKLLAVGFLAEGVSHGLDQAVALRLMFNDSGLGPHHHELIRRSGAPQILFSNVGVLLSLFVPLTFSRASHPASWKSASLIGAPLMASVVASFVGWAASAAMPPIDVSLEAIRIVLAVAAPTFWWLALRLTRNKYLFVAAAMQLSAAAGNLGNAAIHPWGVIDFVVFPALSLDLVFNLADVAILLSIGMMLGYPLVAVFGYAPGFATTWSKLVWPIEPGA